jgi:hypothetical protein
MITPSLFKSKFRLYEIIFGENGINAELTAL